MKRIALMFLRSFFVLPYYLFRLFQLCNIEKYDNYTRYGFLHKITPKINRRGRVKVICHGIENIPEILFFRTTRDFLMRLLSSKHTSALLSQ